MSDIVLRATALGKAYRRGVQHQLLSELIGNAFRRRKSSVNIDESAPFWAFQDVSFDIQAGEVVGLIGRNGSGKSTLLKVLSRITEPTSGTADIHGTVASLLELGTGFHPELTGRENIFLNGTILGNPRSYVASILNDVVHYAELESFIDTPIKHYSSGMLARLAFATAAHLRSDVLIVDEVLAVGDLAFQRKCLDTMQGITHNERTVLFVSHQMNAIRRLCKRCIWLEGGRMRMIGSAAEVVSSYEKESLQLPEESVRIAHGARFTSWRIKDPTTPNSTILATDGPFVLTITLDCAETIESARIRLMLFGPDNDLMWGWVVNLLRFDRGLHELDFALPGLPLRPGVYRWQIGLDGDRGDIDVWHCMPELIIATEPLGATKDEWAGCLNLGCHFETRQLG